MISDQEKKLAETIIKLHDGKNFDLLKEMSLPSPTEESEDTITEDMYIEACEDIRQELGLVNRIEYIDCLKRKNSQLTLWKAIYTSSEDEVFWGIGFDRETLKVKDVQINW
jgi:hypothetical protein